MVVTHQQQPLNNNSVSPTTSNNNNPVNSNSNVTTMGRPKNFKIKDILQPNELQNVKVPRLLRDLGKDQKWYGIGLTNKKTASTTTPPPTPTPTPITTTTTNTYRSIIPCPVEKSNVVEEKISSETIRFYKSHNQHQQHHTPIPYRTRVANTISNILQRAAEEAATTTTTGKMNVSSEFSVKQTNKEDEHRLADNNNKHIAENNVPQLPRYPIRNSPSKYNHRLAPNYIKYNTKCLMISDILTKETTEEMQHSLITNETQIDAPMSSRNKPTTNIMKNSTTINLIQEANIQSLENSTTNLSNKVGAPKRSKICELLPNPIKVSSVDLLKICEILSIEKQPPACKINSYLNGKSEVNFQCQKRKIVDILASQAEASQNLVFSKNESKDQLVEEDMRRLNIVLQSKNTNSPKSKSMFIKDYLKSKEILNKNKKKMSMADKVYKYRSHQAQKNWISKKLANTIPTGKSVSVAKTQVSNEKLLSSSSSFSSSSSSTSSSSKFELSGLAKRLKINSVMLTETLENCDEPEVPYVKIEPVVDENNEHTLFKGAICTKCNRCYVSSACDLQEKSPRDQYDEPLGNKLNRMDLCAQEDLDFKLEVNDMCPDCIRYTRHLERPLAKILNN